MIVIQNFIILDSLIFLESQQIVSTVSDWKNSTFARNDAYQHLSSPSGAVNLYLTGPKETKL